MTDPFYMLMLLNLLGKSYIVWDKSASIRYKVPAKGVVYATFQISPHQLEKFDKRLFNTVKPKQSLLYPLWIQTVISLLK